MAKPISCTIKSRAKRLAVSTIMVRTALPAIRASREANPGRISIASSAPVTPRDSRDDYNARTHAAQAGRGGGYRRSRRSHQSRRTPGLLRLPAIGVVLTGTLGDGASGLTAIEQTGGVTVVQNPKDAAFPEMPENAIRRNNPDHVVYLREMPALLDALVRQPVGDRSRCRTACDTQSRLREVAGRAWKRWIGSGGAQS
jgi:hypothetical protein